MIKFIYFDVGGVVIKDFSGTNKWSELKKDIGVSLSQNEDFDAFFDKYESELCMGRNLKTLLPLIKKEFSINFPKNYIFLNEFVNRFDKNDTLWPLLEKLRNKYRICLLTNMYPNMLNEIYKRKIMPSINWDTIIDSSIEGFSKPSTQIYKIAQQKANVKSNQIIFIDNSQKNIKAAQEVGWNTFLYDSSNLSKSNKLIISSIIKF